MRKISVWKSLELDHTLIESDKLGKSLNSEIYLGVNELPKAINIFACIVHLINREINLQDGVVF